MSDDQSVRLHVLQARSLSKRFGGTLALDCLDLTVNAGEIVCLLGANGAGKTTTLNLFLSFLAPSDGEVLVNGRAVRDDPVAARAALGHVAEIVSLYWALLVFVVPVATASLATLLNPPPSRFEQITAARTAEVRASRDFDDDHPDLSSITLAGRRASVDKGIEVRGAVAAAVAPLRRDYDADLDVQQNVGRTLAVLSPPTLTADALAAAAGTDAAAYVRQRKAAEDYLQPLGRALIATARGERPVDAATFDALPRFVAPNPSRIGFGVAGLLLLITSALVILATARLRRVRLL